MVSMIVGIDPGLNGAIALYDSNTLEVHDMPVIQTGPKSRRVVDYTKLHMLIYPPSLYAKGIEPHVFLENVWNLPGEGGSSSFNFGKGIGMLQGAIGTLQLPHTLVTPQKWKKALGVPAVKDGARGRASQLMPKYAENWPLKKHDGRAEAAMIAYYGYKQLKE